MSRLKVVLDTNILVSSLWPGNPWKVVKRWRDGHIHLIVSEPILREYLSVLGRFVQPADLVVWAQLLNDPQRVAFVKPVEQVALIRTDPTDNRFLECAATGSADIIVSGDHHLLDLSTFRNISILTPAQFLKRFPA